MSVPSADDTDQRHVTPLFQINDGNKLDEIGSLHTLT